jgi:hypothetical protein
MLTIFRVKRDLGHRYNLEIAVIYLKFVLKKYLGQCDLVFGIKHVTLFESHNLLQSEILF